MLYIKFPIINIFKIQILNMLDNWKIMKLTLISNKIPYILFKRTNFYYIFQYIIFFAKIYLSLFQNFILPLFAKKYCDNSSFK